MYRRTKKYQQQVAYLAAAQADREQKQLDGANPVVQTNLPEFRRIIEITDFDSGTPVTHRIELYRSDRIDCYNVNIDGQPWVQRMGWSRILAALRNALRLQLSDRNCSVSCSSDTLPPMDFGFQHSCRP